MPTYEYECAKCGVFETQQRITEDALKSCPTCGSPVKRLVSGTAFHLKGSGWYKTDYASSGSAGKKSSGTAASATEKSSDTSTEKTSDASKSPSASGGGESAAPVAKPAVESSSK